MSAPIQLPFSFWLIRQITGDVFYIREGEHHLICPATKQNWQWLESKLKMLSQPHGMTEADIAALPDNPSLGGIIFPTHANPQDAAADMPQGSSP